MSFKISKKFFCIYLLILLNNLSSIYGSQNVKIAFVITELIERGVQVSTYDFAHFNETLLGNESFIINFDIATDNDVRKKFMNRFPGRFFDCVSSEDMDYILSQEQIDILYRQKPGENTDNILSKVCKNAIHAYYPLDLQIHGDVYAFVSDWFTKKFPESGVPVVPLIVQVAETNENLRAELGIPEKALVFGRHGGLKSFNVPCALDAIKEVARARSDIYFIFMGTESFCDLANVIFLPASVDMLYKSKFINTCDAMIFARWVGETFGLACGEFSIKNKPVLLWAGSTERAHIDILGDKGLYFNSKQELISLILNFKREPNKNWDAYSDKYTPELVMKKFDDVFIKPLIKDRKSIEHQQRLSFMSLRTDEALSAVCVKHLQELFNCQNLIQEGKNIDQLETYAHHFQKCILVGADDHARADSYINIDISKDLINACADSKQGKSLIIIDCYARNGLEKLRNSSIPLDFEVIVQNSKNMPVVLIDGAHLISPHTFQELYQIALTNSYRFLIYDTAILLFPDQKIQIDPLVQAMTASWLCEIDQFAYGKTISELLSSEHYIGRMLSEKCVQTFDYIPLNFQSRYFYLWKSLAYLHAREYEKAAFILQHLISLGCNHWRIYWYLGKALYYLGDKRAEHAMLYVYRNVPQFNGIQQFKKDISW